jgi:hypothetical protein
MASAPPAPPPPPRPITAAAHRRTWTDPIIRFWILATVVLVGIGGWFVTQQVIAARSEQWLIANGVAVNAYIVDANGDSHADAPPGSVFDLKFTLPGQSEVVVSGTLATQTTLIKPRTYILLHVNPNDPSDWTDRQEPEPLARRLIAGSVIVPSIIITALAALLLRRRMLRLWRNAEASLFTVVESRHSALAPLSHTVRCVVSTGRDSNIVTVYVPAKFPRPKTGEVLWLIHDPKNAKGAIAACAFE